MSFSATNLIPSTSTASSFSFCSSRTTPKVGPPQPKPLIASLTASLFLFFRFSSNASFVLLSIVISIKNLLSGKQYKD
ncbi:hypothetical protein HMPREF1982_01612 [Clostridiales bacterium oral taxon 876 str. F0540]|nr:hypothetical protein HMPREF1982_01612 [Clostridiales bacterium oral taxon 876 str. F0540]